MTQLLCYTKPNAWLIPGNRAFENVTDQVGVVTTDQKGGLV